jgi:hypothetical protein
MASDTFTGADDTPLATHDAAWASVNATYVVGNFEIWGNACRTTGTFSTAGARRTDSTEDTSEAVLPAQTTADTAIVRAVAVRLDGTTRGYAIRFRTASGSNWTRASLVKNGTFVADFGSGTWAMNAAHTLKIVAEQSGANVILHGYVDGPEIGTGITDSTSPYSSGLNPGFWVAGNGTIANNTFDDWTDGAAGGAAYSDSAAAAGDGTATASDAAAFSDSAAAAGEGTATASDTFTAGGGSNFTDTATAAGEATVAASDVLGCVDTATAFGAATVAASDVFSGDAPLVNPWRKEVDRLGYQRPWYQRGPMRRARGRR